MKSHTRVFTMFVALAVVATIVIWGFSQKVHADAQPRPNPENAEAQRVAIAEYLPGDTLGVISVYDAPLERVLWETGMADAITSEFTEPIENRVKALREYAGRVRSLHLAMKEFRPGQEPPSLLLIAETDLPDAVAALPEIIREDLDPDGRAYEVEIFRLRMDELFEAVPRRQAIFQPESPLFVAGHDGLLWIGSDRFFLEESISLMMGNAQASLARNESYQSLSANALDGSVDLFVSAPAILRMVEYNMSRRERDRFRTYSEIYRLRNIEAGSVVIGGDHLSVRLKVDDGDRFATIRTPAAGPAILADFVPDESLLFIDYRFDDARQYFEELKNYLFDIMLANEQVGSRREFEEGIRGAEEAMGFRFDEAIDVIAHEFAQNIGREEFTMLLEVKDVDRANDFIMRLLKDFDIITRTVDDIEYYTAGDRMFDFCWAAVDNVIIFSINDEAIRSAVMSRKRDLTLARSKHYRKLAERLPAVNSVHMYMDVLGFINLNSESRHDRRWDDMPAELRRWVEGLALATAINIDDDVIELRLVSSKQITEAVVVNIVETWVENLTAHKIPEEVLERTIRVIDVEALEVFEVTVKDFELRFETDPATGFKIDHRGRRIAVPMICATCRELVPPAPIPRDVDDDEYENILMNYRCPRCAERVYGM